MLTARGEGIYKIILKTTRADLVGTEAKVDNATVGFVAA
jgi:hypothetical protein